MKTNKTVSCLLAALLTASLAACGGAPATPAAAPANPSSAAPQPSQTQAVKTAEPGKLILGTSADYAPYEFHILEDGKDKIVGFDISLAQRIADDLGLELVIKDMNFESILMELQQGTVDIAVAGIVPTEERKKEMDFSQNYYSSKQTIVVKKENLEKYTTLDSFQGLPVGAQLSTVQEELVKTVLTGAQPVLLSKIPDLIMEVKTGKIEGVCLVGTVADGYVATQDDLAIAMEVPYDGSVSAVAVNKENPELLAAVNKTISALLSDGTMDKFVAEASALANTVAAAG